MKSTLKQLATAASLFSLMSLTWWGSWIDTSDYQFGAEIQKLAGQQINSENHQQEDLHFLEKEDVAPPIEENKK